MTNLVTLLTESARARGDGPAVRQGETLLTYARLDDMVARFARLLRDSGVRPGDRVAMAVPNVVQFPVSYYGILRAGGVVVPLNPLLKARELAFVLGDSRPVLVLASPSCAGEVEEAARRTGVAWLTVGTTRWERLLRDTEPESAVAERADEDTAVILYTSGTTGSPKGAELTHRNLMTNALTTARTVLRISRDDVVFGGLPLFHAFGQTCALNAALGSGATLTLLPRFDPAEALRIMARDKVTLFLGVPTMYTALLHSGTADGSGPQDLRIAVSGGASLPVETLHAFERRYDVVVLEGYGLSETSPVATFNPPDGPRRPGSVGLPVSGVELRVVADDGTPVRTGEVGEIVVRGENVMKGYWNRPDATNEVLRDGWLHTGDLGRVDADGYCFVVDRKKDLIIRAGYNVYPREIEEVLHEHPAVAEAAVIGVPHETHGEEVTAVVSLRAGARAEAEHIRDFVKRRVAAYKYPRVVRIVDALPKGATGKILKRELSAGR
ncbi:long-chain fatty acid--CoA ligase [Streptomyces sp. NPDC087512]|uniref:long-chain-fatty-acid--CoA ligase n=1 Tax=Streptomyces sp. NPDC087512 TaxID=3155059 RepID=UPI00343F114A